MGGKPISGKRLPGVTGSSPVAPKRTNNLVYAKNGAMRG